MPDTIMSDIAPPSPADGALFVAVVQEAVISFCDRAAGLRAHLAQPPKTTPRSTPAVGKSIAIMRENAQALEALAAALELALEPSTDGMLFDPKRWLDAIRPFDDLCEATNRFFEHNKAIEALVDRARQQHGGA